MSTLEEVILLARQTGLIHVGSDLYKTLSNLPRVHNGVELWKVWDGIEIVEDTSLEPDAICAVQRGLVK